MGELVNLVTGEGHRSAGSPLAGVRRIFARGVSSCGDERQILTRFCMSSDESNNDAMNDVLAAELSRFSESARWVAHILAKVPSAAWSGPGLGDWDLRALAGHTSRALLTVEQYLDRPAEVIDIGSSEEYYSVVQQLTATDDASILRRGIEAGLTLGPDPASSFSNIAERVIARVAGAPDRIVTTIVGGMKLSAYLPTRTFELVVHGLDLAKAAGVKHQAPDSALLGTLDLATGIAVRQGDATMLLLALTGRGGLPNGYSVC